MTAVGIPANARQLTALVKEGEGPALEFKRSTGELKEGMQTLCAFLNGDGGRLLFGAQVMSIEAETVRYRQQNVERVESAAMIVTAMGARSENDLESALKEISIPYRIVGDAKSPRRILEAIHEGHKAGEEI